MRGLRVRARGANLDQAKLLVFRGGRGRTDDVSASATDVSPEQFQARVPRGARTGRLDLVTVSGDQVPLRKRVRVVQPAPPPKMEASGAGSYFGGGRPRPTLVFVATSADEIGVQVVRESDGAIVRTLSVPAASGAATWNGGTDAGPAPTGRYRLQLAPGADATGEAVSFSYYDHLFPIRGKHDLGQSGTNNYGGGRNHQGQDMFAECGVPLAAARGGRVRYAGTQERAGNYVVITSTETKLDYVYMHLQDKPEVSTGDRVKTGQSLGRVGDSGNASGCHLHFELWTEPGWYTGGETINPLPMLEAWDGWS